MKPIIDPFVVYCMGVSDSVKTTCIVLFVSVLVGFISAIIAYIYNSVESVGYSRNEKYISLCKKLMTISGIMSFFLGIIAIFVPWKETIIEMLIANQITPDNVNIGVDGIKSIIDYVIETIQKLK